ncbi:MAG: NusG domain II-containing protein [Ruminococcaceae bacterium]|nr:NusG domain II-containing protein [Oscillospiraceae bacterium]
MELITMNNKCKEEEQDSSSLRQKRNDIIFVAIILLAVLAAALVMLLLRTSGDKVIVSIDGKLFGEYSLNENRSVEIKTDEGYNLLIIEDGKAYVKEASCPDGICSSHRPISYGGESIICLPNKVVVEIRTDSKDIPDVIV